jgi:hypothetical protein
MTDELTTPPDTPDDSVLSVPMMMGTVDQRFTVERSKMTDGSPCVLVWITQPMTTACLLLSIDAAKNMARELTEKALGISIAEAVANLGGTPHPSENGGGTVLRLPGT